MLSREDGKFVSMRDIRNRLAKSRRDEGLDVAGLSGGIITDFESKANRDLLDRLNQEAVRHFMESELDQDTSRSMVAVSMANFTTGYALEFLKDQAIVKGNVGELIAWIDTLTGFERILSLFQLAEIQLRGDLDSTLQQIFKDMKEADGLEQTSTTGAGFAQDYLISIREAKMAADLLIQDPSGFTLIDRSIERYSAVLTNPGAPREPYLPSNVIPEFFIRGARMAEAAYKHIYPLTETPTS